jgi:hypothetical protein
MRGFSGALALLGAVACTPVDVSPEVVAFSGGVSKATAALEGDLSLRAAGEEASARSGALAAGDLLYVPPTACILAASGATSVGDCQLQPLVRARAEPGSATAMLAYLDLLQAYAEALTLLATGKEPDTVGKALGGVVGAAEDLAEVVPDLADQTRAMSRVNAPLSKFSGRLADAQRLRLIRGLVRDAGPGVMAALDRLIAYREVDDGLLSGAEALNTGYDAMEAARRSGDAGAYAAAVAAYEAAHQDLQRRLADSDAGRLMLIREAQLGLEARLAKPGSLSDYMELIDTLGALSRAVEG